MSDNHNVAYSTILLIFQSCMVFHCKTMPLIYSTVDELLDYFQLRAITKNAPMNIWFMSWYTKLLLYIYVGVKCLGQRYIHAQL